MSKRAIVIGATGLVGSHLTQQLLADVAYAVTNAFVRRPTGTHDPKLHEHVVDFEKIDAWASRLTGDVLFSTLGTTIKQAGSKQAQYRVDYTYQFEVAQAAAQNNVPTCVLVSSAGADPRSRVFYTRIKGELDEAIKKLPFERVVILRPSVLTGQRREPRAGERLGARLIDVAARVLPPLSKYRPIPAETVAHAMIRTASDASASRVRIYELDEIFTLVGS